MARFFNHQQRMILIVLLISLTGSVLAGQNSCVSSFVSPRFTTRHKMKHQPIVIPSSAAIPAQRQTPTSALRSSTNPFVNSALAITSSTPAISMTIRAALALFLSALAGVSWDRARGSGPGTMITLLVAAHFSNLNLSPPTHFLYDFCWTGFLPASLALLLLSPSQDSDAEDTRDDIVAVAIPFAIGCIGSILGCVVSFWTCLHANDFHPFLSGHVLLPPKEALVTAGCICASYIGGHYNFFAAAHIIAKRYLGDDGGLLHSLFGASAAELLVMALYYSVITALLSSTILKSIFPGRPETRVDTSDSSEATESARSLPLKRRFTAGLTCAGLAGGIVALASACDLVFARTKCAFIVGFGAIVSRFFRTHKNGERMTTLLNDMKCVAATMSEFCFHLLFAAIGSSANLKEAVQQGGWHSLSSFVFSAMAQLVHLVVILVGSLAVNKVFRKSLGVEEIMVASNAAIGGPVTAAAFAGKEAPNRRGLVVAATVWGVVGYAVGTRIGVKLTRVLLPLLPTS